MSYHNVAKYNAVPLEQPAASAGRDLLHTTPSTIRPIIGGKRRHRTVKKRKQQKPRKSRRHTKKQSGGFLPSIGEPFVAAVSKYIAPLALFGIYKFINGKGKTRKVNRSRK
jgi:hypothetical protein